MATLIASELPALIVGVFPAWTTGWDGLRTWCFVNDFPSITIINQDQATAHQLKSLHDQIYTPSSIKCIWLKIWLSDACWKEGIKPINPRKLIEDGLIIQLFLGLILSNQSILKSFNQMSFFRMRLHPEVSPKIRPLNPAAESHSRAQDVCCMTCQRWRTSSSRRLCCPGDVNTHSYHHELLRLNIHMAMGQY